jgi:hypothetical protein
MNKGKYSVEKVTSSNFEDTLLIGCHPAKCSPEKRERSHVLSRAFVRDPVYGLINAKNSNC